jgi:hypothetical protein
MTNTLLQAYVSQHVNEDDMEDYPFIRQLTSPVTDTQLRPLDSRCRVVQFDSPLSQNDFQRVAQLLRQYPNVTLRIYGHYEQPCDLEFLHNFPFLRRFEVDVYDLQNIEGLAYLPTTLHHFGFGQTKTRRFSLNFLERFPSLRSLFVDGHTKHIEVVGQLHTLNSLTLRSITLPDLSILSSLRQLQSLSIKLGGIKDVSLLPEIGKLRYLELWLIRGLANLQALGAVETLQYLFLQALRQVQHLPSLANLHHLRRVHLETMKGMIELSSVADAPILEELLVFDMPQLQPDAFRPFVGHSHLKRVTVGLGSVRKDREVDQLLKLPRVNRGKEDFNFAEVLTTS